MTDETPRLTGLTIKNYKCLENIDLQNLPPVVCLIGKNGSGKTTVLKSLELIETVHELSREAYNYKDDFPFEEFIEANRSNGGVGEAILLEFSFNNQSPVLLQKIQNFNSSSLQILNQISTKSEIDEFKHHLENSAYFQINNKVICESSDDIRSNFLEHDGENLPNVAFHIQNDFLQIWEGINETLRQFVKGFYRVIAVRDDYRRTFLRFYNHKHEQVLLPKEMSDGTLLMLAHLLLLRHPKPHPILCIDEPEHHLYPSFLSYLAEEIKEYAHQAGNVFLSTHSPDLVNALPFESIYYCKKNDDNVTEIHRLADNDYLSRLYNEEGYLAGEMLRDRILDTEFK